MTPWSPSLADDPVESVVGGWLQSPARPEPPLPGPAHYSLSVGRARLTRLRASRCLERIYMVVECPSACVCWMERWWRSGGGEGARVCRGSRPARSLSLGVWSSWRVARVRANASGAGPSDGACSIGTSAPADASTLVPPAHASERARWPLRARARVSCFLIGCRGVVSAADWLVGWPRARAVSVFNKIL